jgi:hypothetical protein
MIQCMIHNVKQTTNIRYVEPKCTTEYDRVLYMIHSVQQQTIQTKVM